MRWHSSARQGGRWRLVLSSRVFWLSPGSLSCATNMSILRPMYFIGKEDTLHPKMLARLSMLETLPTGTNFDLVKYVFKLEAAKHKKMALSVEMNQVWPTKYPGSFAKNRCEMFSISRLFTHTENPYRKSPSTAIGNILLRAFIKIGRSNGERGSLHLKQRELLESQYR